MKPSAPKTYSRFTLVIIILCDKAYHLGASILESLGMDGEGTDQLLGREIHLDLPAIALYSHLIKVTPGVGISHL